MYPVLKSQWINVWSCDPDNAVIGGVAAGLSAYFNIDLLFIRILFVVLILAGAGFPFLLYLVLWIAVPKARTAAEKLEMQGEKVNVSNLEKKIREEYEEVKGNFRKVRNSEAGQRTESFFEEFFRIIGVILVAFGKIILAFIAIGFVIAGISLIASLVGVAFFGAGVGTIGVMEIWDTEVHNFVTPFIDPMNLTVIAISGILLALIPVLAIIYGLFKALFRFKAKDRGLGMSALGLWFLALITLVTLGIIEGKEYVNNETVITNIEVEDYRGDTLYVSMNMENLPKTIVEDFGPHSHEYYFDDEDNLYGKVSLIIREADEDFFEMDIRKSSYGSSESNALSNARYINYDFSRKDSLLFLNPWFAPSEEGKWRAQKIELILFIPENKAVHLDESTADFLRYTRNENNYPTRDMTGKTWIMKDNKLYLN